MSLEPFQRSHQPVIIASLDELRLERRGGRGMGTKGRRGGGRKNLINLGLEHAQELFGVFDALATTPMMISERGEHGRPALGGTEGRRRGAALQGGSRSTTRSPTADREMGVACSTATTTSSGESRDVDEVREVGDAEGVDVDLAVVSWLIRRRGERRSRAGGHADRPRYRSEYRQDVCQLS